MGKKVMYEQDALQTIRNTKNQISGKKIYLKAISEYSGTPNEYRGVTSAGLGVWKAVDFLVNHCGYSIVYEVSGKKAAIDEG